MRMMRERKVSRTKEHVQSLEEGRLCLCLAKHWARWVEEEEAGRDFVC